MRQGKNGALDGVSIFELNSWERMGLGLPCQTPFFHWRCEIHCTSSAFLGNRPTSGSGEVACLGFCCGRVRVQASQISESVVLEGTLVVLEVQNALDFPVVQCPHCIKI